MQARPGPDGGKDRGERMLGIDKLEGDRLTICTGRLGVGGSGGSGGSGSGRLGVRPDPRPP